MNHLPNHSIAFAKTFSDFIAGNSDVRAILDKLVSDIVEHMGIQICAVILRDENNPWQLYMATARGLSADHQKAFNLLEGEGITGGVVATGATRTVPNIHEEPEYSYQELALEEKLCSLTSIPLRHRQSILGALNVYTSSEQLRKISADEIDLLSLLANWTAFALHNNEKREAQEQQRRNLIEEVMRETQVLETQEAIAGFVLPKAVALVGGDFGYLAMVDYERMRFAPIYPHRRKIDDVRRLRIGSWHEGIAGYVVRSGKPEIVGEVTRDPRYKIRGHHRIQSKLLVPLKYQERVIGIINIDAHKKRAQAYMQVNLPGLALGDFRTVARLDPTDPEPHMMLGRAAKIAGQTGVAIREFETFLKLHKAKTSRPKSADQNAKLTVEEGRQAKIHRALSKEEEDDIFRLRN
ncbi:MAG: GAF domain-containing protein, partial [candidate division KSB1 bacterium]